MRLNIALLIVLVFYSIAVHAQNGGTGKWKSDRDERDLVGPVHVVRIESELIESLNKVDSGGGWIPCELIFDRAGNILESVEYDNNGQITLKSMAEVDSAGNKVKEVQTDASGAIVYTIFMDYDRNGNQIEYKRLNGDGSVYSWSQAFYDKQGKITSHTSLSGDGSIVITSTILYDKNGKIRGELPQFTDVKLDDHAVITYSNENGVESELTRVIGADGVLQYRYVYSIDKKGDESQFSYDGNGKLLDKDTYEYTKRDTHANWTIETSSSWEDKDGKLVLITKKRTKRTITYY